MASDRARSLSIPDAAFNLDVPARPPDIPEVGPHLVDAVLLPYLLKRKAHLLEHPEYPDVRGEDLRHETEESLLFGEVGEAAEELSTHPLPMIVVPHHVGDLCHVGLAGHAVLADPNDRLPLGLFVLHHRQDHHLLRVVDDGEVLEPSVG